MQRFLGIHTAFRGELHVVGVHAWGKQDFLKGGFTLVVRREGVCPVSSSFLLPRYGINPYSLHLIRLDEG